MKRNNKNEAGEKAFIIGLVAVLVAGTIGGFVYVKKFYHGPGSESGWVGYKNYKENHIYQYTSPVGDTYNYYFGKDGNTYTMDPGKEYSILLPLSQFEVHGTQMPGQSNGTTEKE